jgi:NAD(P)-dependent dehydrogenase (short-subunit alcohol dehydrogenase family)
MQRSFHGKRVLITGAVGGMGMAFARRFAAEGATLILTDLDGQGLAQASAALRAEAGDCSVHVCDLSSEQERQQLVAAVHAQGSKLDVLINNAGIAYGDVAYQFERLTQSQWLQFLTVNTLAPLLLAQALRPLLAEARGSVINISSMASYMPATAYGVTKAALNAMTYGMASAFGADAIRVNAIAPGIMETPAALANLPPGTFERVQGAQMLKQRGVADDIAALALFLASEEARFMTCEIVSCDAGNRMRGWR